MFRAYIDTRNYEFEGYGKTENKAITACYAGWLGHAKLYNLDKGHILRDEISVYEVKSGSAYIDREEV